MDKAIKLRVLYDQVLVEPIPEPTSSPGGIALPEASQKKPHRGTVISVGEGQVLAMGSVHKIPIEPGDVVVYRRGAGQMVECDGKELRVLRAAELLCVEESPKAIATREVPRKTNQKKVLAQG